MACFQDMNTWLDFIASCFAYYFIMVSVTIVFLRLFITVFPFKEGKFNSQDHAWELYRWGLWNYLYSSNLFFISDNILIPPMFRKVFYQCLGTRAGKGIILICATISDPALLEVEADVIIGEGSVVVGHLLNSLNKLTLGKVILKKGVVVGAMSFISPGVIIGENSLLKIASVVYPNTIIPPNQVWGGNPAVYIKSLKS